jgi:two-component system sensor histidine kinase PilS (NtrC family)
VQSTESGTAGAWEAPAEKRSSRFFMKPALSSGERDLFRQLKWLMVSRAVFTLLLLGSTVLVQLGRNLSPLGSPLSFLYVLIAAIFTLSILYGLVMRKNADRRLMAMVQIGLDTFIVTLFIYVSGGFASIFSYLYLVVIIYASVLLYRKGCLLIAALCCVQYAALSLLEHFSLLIPYGIEVGSPAYDVPLSLVIYKSVILTAACFAVAFLGSLLAEQARRSKKELDAIRQHVKRVEKMAAVGEMAAGLAHELKNPLAAMTGCIQLLREDTAFDAGQEKLMRIILKETDRLGSLVGDFLMFARPPRGRNEPLCLPDLLSDILALFEKDPVCGEGLRVVRNFVPDVWVRMDRGHLRQVVWNLLLNAADAVEPEGTIVVEMRPAGRRNITLCIRDDGCGISGEHLASIFDPFFTTKSRGTGLGLSVVHRILESHDIRIDVDSREWQGTRFSMRFPTIPTPAVAHLKAA